MRVPDDIRQCVVFLGFPNKNGRPIYSGTGFFIGLRSSSNKEMGYRYIVTAKHVAANITGKPIIIGINAKDGGSNFSHATINKWWTHPYDSTVDVAVSPFNLSHDQFEFKEILDEMLGLDEKGILEKGIGTGDEVFVVGLFSRFNGDKKNIPIIRMGNIAMIPDERIYLKNIGDADVHLIEVMSLGGLSGSPVFVCENNVINGKRPFHLYGLIHGHWNLEDNELIDNSSKDEKDKINMGVAIVVPAKKIMETINHPELIKMREKKEKEHQKKYSKISL